MRFREIGQTFTHQFADRQAVVEHLRASFRPWPDLDHLDPANIQTEYSHESAPTNEGKTGWGKVYIVTLEGYGAVGFCDQPLDALPVASIRRPGEGGHG